MAKYLLLIFGDGDKWAAMSAEESKAHEAGHIAFSEAVGTKVLGAAELRPAPAAVTVRAAENGEVLSIDGPFAETKEAVGGYYLIEADNIDDVTRLVELLPEVHAEHSGIEIRELVEH